MDTGKIKAVIAAAVIVMISLAFYIPNVAAMDTAAREFETACKKGSANTTSVRYKVAEIGTWTPGASNTNGDGAATAALTKGASGSLAIPATAGGDCTVQVATMARTLAGGSDAATWGGVKLELDNGEEVTLSATVAVGTATNAAVNATLTGYTKRDVASILNQFGTINRLVLGILPLLLILASFAYGALLVTGTGESISKSVKGEIAGLVLLQITTAFLPSILQFLVTASGATGGQYGVTNDFGGIINIVFGVIPIVMVVALIALIGQRIYREASSRGMVGAMA